MSKKNRINNVRVFKPLNFVYRLKIVSKIKNLYRTRTYENTFSLRESCNNTTARSITFPMKYDITWLKDKTVIKK